jgi:hypothetical protein
MRCESCSAPPSKRRSGPRSLVAKNGDSGSPQRIQNNAASNDVGALLRANTPSIAVASACLAALDSTCVHNQSCNVPILPLGAPSTVLPTARIPPWWQAAAAWRVARSASPSSSRKGSFEMIRLLARQCTVPLRSNLETAGYQTLRPARRCNPALVHPLTAIVDEGAVTEVACQRAPANTVLRLQNKHVRTTGRKQSCCVKVRKPASAAWS